MTNLFVHSSKGGQLKIQQMAFVLVITMIFFAMIATVFVSIWLTSLRDTALRLEEEEAKKTAAAISGAPELSYTFKGEGKCASCVDLEKALALKTQSEYISSTNQNFWNYDFFQIERIYPQIPAAYRNKECVKMDVPNWDCGKITLVKSTEGYGKTSTAYVTLVHYVPEQGGYFKYEIGRIFLSKKEPKT
jgi:hypothetical protein